MEHVMNMARCHDGITSSVNCVYRVEQDLAYFIKLYQQLEETETTEKLGKRIMEEIEKDVKRYTEKLLMMTKNAVAVLKIMQEKKELPNLYDKLPEELVREIASYVPVELGRAVMVIRARNIMNVSNGDSETYYYRIRILEIVKKLNKKQIETLVKSIVRGLRGSDLRKFDNSSRVLTKNLDIRKNASLSSLRELVDDFLYNFSPQLQSVRDMVEDEYTTVNISPTTNWYYIKMIYTVLGVVNYYGKRDYGI